MYSAVTLFEEELDVVMDKLKGLIWQGEEIHVKKYNSELLTKKSRKKKKDAPCAQQVSCEEDQFGFLSSRDLPKSSQVLQVLLSKGECHSCE